MTTKPQLKLGSHLVPGLAAVALFVVMAVVFLGASFPNPQGFPEGANITASIGYSMFNLGFGSVDGESMLVAFEIIDLVLVAALAGAVLLARREDTTGQMRTILTDGGRELKQALFDDEEGDN
ncbi:proton-conducting membrane transporter [Haloferax volcanii]|uniref:Proton-conducting membrane transporter n=1 Tax=Haloferax volcanii TaxID=2246 RepID=A0A6C0UPZ3_HALVO|nr:MULTISPECIES: proton-conducting membrane transporter [Haloferax]NLV01911.1 proton-conducting membrane transporter [Haloferax alexandrinus]QIB77514.1 proton-conducting membrane transporter [Haloferax alexandrinus]TVT96545.1 proton-conducting membrane transporter [Haloferax volcanii]